jgi:hypothetical protein
VGLGKVCFSHDFHLFFVYVDGWMDGRYVCLLFVCLLKSEVEDTKKKKKIKTLTPPTTGISYPMSSDDCDEKQQQRTENSPFFFLFPEFAT